MAKRTQRRGSVSRRAYYGKFRLTGWAGCRLCHHRTSLAPAAQGHLSPQPLSTAMSAEVFNPNPTIFAPLKAKKTTHAYAKPNSIWLDDGERADEDEYDFDQSDDPETIDQDEIFGTSTDYPHIHRLAADNHPHRTHSVNF